MKKATVSNVSGNSGNSARNEADEILLDLPMISLQAAKNSSLQRISKDDLKRMVEPLQRLLKGKKLTFAPKSATSIINLIESINDSHAFQKFCKDDFIRLYLSFSSSVSNIYSLAKTDARLMQCWRSIIRETSVSSNEIKEITGEAPVVAKIGYWGREEYIDCRFCFLKVQTYEYPHSYYNWNPDKRIYFFTISPADRESLSKLFFGDEFTNPEILEELPPDCDLGIMDFERNMPSDIAYVSGLAMSGNPLSATKNIVPAAKLKSIKNSFHTPVFPYFGGNGDLDRIELLLCAYFCLNTSVLNKMPSSDPLAFVRDAVTKFPRMIIGPQFSMFLPEFKGFARSWTEMSMTNAVTEAAESLIMPSINGWMSLSNLKFRFLCCPVPEFTDEAYNHLFTFRGREKSSLRSVSDGDYESWPVYSAKWLDEIDFPFVLHWIKFLCGIGLAEIAYDKAPEKYDSLEGMRYVRMTALGRYAFGIDNEYTLPEAETVCSFDFDDDNCIFTILSKDCPYSLFLEQIAVPIGRTRFRITPASLMKGCIDAKELRSKIENLRKIIDIDNTLNLKKTIDEAEARADCVNKVGKGYSILKIKGNVPGFTEFLSSDKEIRQHCLFAENSIMLVEKTFVPKFKTICIKNGYIADF